MVFRLRASEGRGGRKTTRDLVAAKALAITFALFVLASCGTTGADGFDGFSEPDVVERGTIVIWNEVPIGLKRQESATITGEYRDSAGAQASVDIEISLQGNAQDTSLGTTSLTTGSDGGFAFEITGGTIDASFTIRCLASDGAQIDVPVEVSQHDTGSITIDARYGGRRAIDFHRIVITLDEPLGSCPVPAGEPVQSMSTVDSSLPVEVPHLPVSSPLAITLAGAWCPEGSLDSDACPSWVVGCADGITAEPGSGGSVIVDLVDDPSTFGSPSIVAGIDLDDTVAAQAWVEEILAPLAWMQSSDPLPAAMVLDGIGERVASGIGTTEADLFSSARLAYGVDTEVSEALLAFDHDLPGELQTLREAIVAAVAPLRIEGTMEGAFWSDTDQSAVFTIDRIGGSGGAVEADLVAHAVPLTSEVSLSYDSDLVTAAEHSLPVGAGEIVLGLANLVAIPPLLSAPTDPGTQPLAAYLDEAVACTIIASVLSSGYVTGTIADASWYEEACNQVLAGVAAQVQQAADALDAAHPALVIGGACDYLDSNGYPFPDLSCNGAITSARWGEESIAGSHRLRLDMPVVLD